MKWNVYLEMLEGRMLPEHFYWAQIAMEIRRSYAKHPGKIGMDEFLKPYKKVKVEPKKKKKMSLKEHTKAAKEFFFGALGLPLEDK